MRSWLATALSITLLMAQPGWSLGIAMRFVDVTLENVEPGLSVNLREKSNLPLVVINQDTDNSVEIVIEAVAPKDNEMKDGYEPIPDPTWVRTIPNRFRLGPGASASSDVLINIPNDPKLVGHHYEVIVWVHTDQKNRALAQGGVVFQAGLRSRFRLSIGTMGPASLQREKALKKLATINTNFSVGPDNLYIQEVPLGKTIDLKVERKQSLKVVNQADEDVSLKFVSASADPNVQPESGYTYAADPKWLTLTPTSMNVDGNSIKEIKLQLNIPDKPENRGKNLFFLVQTSLKDDSLPLLYHNMIYVKTAP